MKKEIEELIKAGLSENEAKTYVHLLRQQVFTATEISRVANVNRSKIYQVLDSLVQKGLCLEKPGKIKKYEAISPELAFDKLKEHHVSAIEQISHLPDILTPIYKNMSLNATPLDFIEVYGTPNSIINKYNLLELGSQDFVYSFCKSPYAMSDTNVINEEQLISMSKGVVYKSIFEIEPNNPKWFVKKMRSFVEQGEEIRVAHHLPIKLHIFDKKTVMFSMTNSIRDKEFLTYLVIEHIDLAETLIRTFETYWQEALTIDDYIKQNNLEIQSNKIESK